ncbi:extracellular solute-binding protein [Actinoplanes sp. NBRC 101535]|uniref:extracellular solute-binding protein n=1 Tax=Actinoplanes sp. NBRC 101535 TaxID=3032196 RepID=UPI0024A237DC|nr:extracellular solute-binding protein [Actinoplanes sp. NBRC 101535]GLY03793.1 polyamine ABC transporter substrate-binding protein [Actinoplanes sp. NBRC 101535]
MTISRRSALFGGIALLGLAACSTSATDSSQQDSSAGGDALTITGFSGAFADQFQAEVIDPFQQANPGTKVTYTPATNSAELLAGLRTNTGKATYDLVIMDSSVSTTANAEGLFEKLDASIVTSLADLVDAAVIDAGFGPAITIDSLAFIANPAKFATLPSKWTALAEAQYKGQLALQIADTRGIALIAGLSKELGLDYKTSIDGQLAELKKFAANTQTFSPQPNIYDAIRSGSVGMGVGWNARAQALHDETPNELIVAVPTGLGVAQISTINLVKTSTRKDVAQKFVEFAIGAEAQKRLSESAFYGSVNKTVTVAEDINARTASTTGLLADAAPIDWNWIAPNYAGWVQRIQREVIGG